MWRHQAALPADTRRQARVDLASLRLGAASQRSDRVSNMEQELWKRLLSVGAWLPLPLVGPFPS